MGKLIRRLIWHGISLAAGAALLAAALMALHGMTGG